MSAIKKNDLTKVKSLLGDGADVNAVDSNLATSAMWAAYASDLQMLQYLISKGASIKNKGAIYINEEKTGYYGNVIGIAAGEGKLNILKYLVEVGKLNLEDQEYDPATKTETGWTALQWAASNGKLNEVKYLVEKGANINADYTADKGTPLTYALQSNHQDVAKHLIENGADVNKADSSGATPLMHAALANDFESCVLLWKNHANFFLKTNNGKIALDLAVEASPSRVLDFIRNPDAYLAIAKKEYWAEMLKLFNQMFTANQYEKAIPLGIKAVHAAKEQNVDSTLQYALFIKQLAESLVKTKQYDLADKFYTKSLTLLRIKQGIMGKEYYTLLYILRNYYENTTMQYDRALIIYEKLLETAKTIAGDKDEIYVEMLNDFAKFYAKTNNYEKAESLYFQAMEIDKKGLKENYPNYAASLNNLASLYEIMGQYEKAESHYIQSKEIRKNLLGENHPDYATSLNNLADLYRRIGQYEKAEPLYIQSKDIRKKVLGENHLDYASSLNNLALLYENMGQFKKAEPLYLQAQKIYQKLLGENHPNYATSLNNLAALYERMGYYEQAEALFLQSKEIFIKVLGENHPSFATSLNNLAGTYKIMGQYEKAESHYIQSKEIRKNLQGENHPDYATSLNNLGDLYERIGQYEKAEPLHLQAKEIYKKALGENHPYYASSLNNLAVIYKSMGQYEKAEPLYIQSKDIRKKVLGENHSDYASSLNNLALLYENMGQYKKAEDLYLKSKDIFKNVLGENHSNYASSLNNLAFLYEILGQYEKAEPLYFQTQEILKKTLGATHSDYATSLNNLGTLYKIMGQYKKAESLFIKAQGINKRALGENHPRFATDLNNLAFLYESMGKYEKAESLKLMATNIILYNLKNTFTILSEKEKGKYLDNNISVIASNNSLLYNYRGSSALVTNNFNLQLFFKSLSLADTRSMIESINKSGDSSTQQLFKNWQAIKSLLAIQFSLPVSNRISNLDSMEARTEMIEKELTRKSAAFREQQKSININLTDVQKNLQPDEVAIEFVRFDLYNQKWTDSTMYAAYILRKNDSVPVFIPLCEEKQLQQLFASVGKTTTASVSAFYRGVGDENENVSVSKGDSLYKLIWQPLEPYLKGIKKISYSPAGKLYTIAFNALPAGDGKILMDKYELQQYTSTRQIALRENKNEKTIPKSIALFGDATFTLDSLQLVKSLQLVTKNSTASTNIYTPQTRGSNNAVWSNLPGTATEVNKIKNLFSQNKIAVKTFVQLQASEEKFKSLSGNSPQVLHLATHGFFLPQADKKRKYLNEGNVYSLAEDPLMRSGILLAGANYTWSGKTPINGVEDGIATAYEISQLDLSKTELVVLSACETALGDIKGSEGVFGLQRSFKMAGVKKLIVSLWQVPDKETAELMTLFYADWLKGNSIENAFYKAQTEMRKKYSPFYWAAFVLVE